MHVRNEHHLRSTKTRMKRLFATRSKPTPLDEMSALSMAAQPPSLVSIANNEGDISLIDESPDCMHRPRSGFHEFIPDHHSAPVEDDQLYPNSSSGGKLRLSELFNFENHHWVGLYEECAKRSYDEELSLYDLLNEDAAAINGIEVDVDETTADILIG